jgi:hypothetical protein
LPTVVLVVVREDPGQAQVADSIERKPSVLLGLVTKSLTTRADANLRVVAAGAWSAHPIAAPAKTGRHSPNRSFLLAEAIARTIPQATAGRPGGTLSRCNEIRAKG